MKKAPCWPIYEPYLLATLIHYPRLYMRTESYINIRRGLLKITSVKKVVWCFALSKLWGIMAAAKKHVLWSVQPQPATAPFPCSPRQRQRSRVTSWVTTCPMLVTIQFARSSYFFPSFFWGGWGIYTGHHPTYYCRLNEVTSFAYAANWTNLTHYLISLRNNTISIN